VSPLALLARQLWIQLVQAFGTDTVRKLRVGMVPDIGFDTFPIAMVIADVFAGGADGQQAAERLDGRQRHCELMVEVSRALQLGLYIPKRHGNDQESHQADQGIPILDHPHRIDTFIEKVIHPKPEGRGDTREAQRDFFIGIPPDKRKREAIEHGKADFGPRAIIQPADEPQEPQADGRRHLW